MTSPVRQPLTVTAARPRGFSLVEIVLALGIVTMVLVAVVGMLTNVTRTLRDSEDDSKLPDLVQQTMQLIQQELSRDAWFEDPTKNKSAKWQTSGAKHQCEYFFSVNQIPQDDHTPPEQREPVYYRILAELKDPPAALPHIPNNALKTLILKVDWPYNEQGNSSLNTRVYSLLLRNSGYQLWEHPQSELPDRGRL
ncbi:MAG: hypothetical protein LBK60_03395 [Verrucomicrobiales bacterium]|nr:hypothetical protein [Verrucomicrobiales bacterium]